MSQVVSLRATLKSLHGVTGGIPTGPPTRTTSKLEDTSRIEEDIYEPEVSQSIRSKYIY